MLSDMPKARLKAHFGDPSASDKNPLKTVIYSKSRELLEQEEGMLYSPRLVHRHIQPSFGLS